MPASLRRVTEKPLSDRIPIGPALSGRVILGCASFGGVGSTAAAIGRGMADEAAFAVMDAAVELGVTIFDTADGYAGGHSETLVGQWSAARPGHPVTFTTKVGVAGGTIHGRDLTPDRIREHALTSRQRLGINTLPMYMIHVQDPDTPVRDSLAAFDRLHRDNVIGSLGMANATVDFLEEWAAAADDLGAIRVSWVQNEYSLMVRRDEAALLPYCRDHGLPYTAFTPLNGGILAGRYQRGKPAPPGSRIAVLTEQYGPRLTDAVHDQLDVLRDFAAERQVGMAAAALAWVMSSPDVAAPLVAPKSPAQFDAVVEAARLHLDAADRARLAAVFA